MKYLAYITNNCQKEAVNYGLQQTVENLAKKIEKDQRISWAYYHAPWLIRKKIGNDFRLMAKLMPMPQQDITLVCFLSVFSKGDYEKYNFDPDTLILPTQNEIEKFIHEKNDDVNIIDSLKSLTDNERNYLNLHSIGFDTSDGMVYESNDWVKSIKTEAMRENFVIIHKVVDEIVWNENLDAGKNFVIKDKIKVIYHSIPQKNITFLINVLNENESPDEILERYAEIITDENIDEEKIRQMSKRAYPQIITADIEVWKLVQKDETANLALSSEETRVLESVTILGEKVYPLFINGRPGSGKSTILHYLFAKHLLAHFEKTESEQIEFPPLYLTYSKKLLDVSIANIRNIVRLNVEKLADNQFKNNIAKLDWSDGTCFGEFHRFLLELLPEDKENSFSQDNRIDFPKFRQFYLDNNRRFLELKNFTPELVWHVIRSYIKGMCDENGDFFDSEDYATFDSKRKTVTQKTFETVFNFAWKGWYKDFCENEGYWDNQDLTRELLDSDIDLSKYPAVFCDEAQDFTPNELELILRLSLFSKRKLQAYELKQVPFAFAGDPFQTLNPTGFDWNKMQATFHEKIIQELDRTNQANLTFNYQELAFNYRSGKNIVGFCNLIQLARGIIFEKKRLNPQTTWSLIGDETRFPEYFDIASTDIQRDLGEQSDIVIILPCQDGEEEEYIEKDDFLRQLRSQGKNLNILSSMGAKGQEFPRVVLYKFGQDCLKDFPALLDALNLLHSDNNDSSEVKLEKRLGWEYFINRLYVAASRPKKQLDIVDTKEGIEKFWKSKVFTNPEELVENYNDFSSADIFWRNEDLSSARPGNSIKPTEGGETDLLALAEQFRDEGRATKSSYLLKLAANNYRNLENHQTDAYICEAERYQLENKLDKAAEEYLQVPNVLKALECYWENKSFKEIVNNTTFQHTSKYRASQFMILDENLNSSKQFLEYISAEIKSPAKHEIISDKNWQTIVQNLIRLLHKFVGTKIDSQEIFSKLILLENNDLRLESCKELAELAFRAGFFQDTVKYWENSDSKYENEKTYLIASYEVGKNFERSSESIKKVFEAYISLGSYEEAFKFTSKHPSFNKNSLENLWEELLKKIPKLGNEDLLIKTAKEALRYNLKQSYLRKAIELVQQQQWDTKTKIELNYLLFDEVDISSVTLPERDNFVNYLKKLVNQTTEVDSAYFKKIGETIEKSGRFVDALAFYESVLDGKKIKEETDIKFAKESWIKSKLKQLKHAKEIGRHKDARKYEEEAKQKASEWKVKVEDFPDYLNAVDKKENLPEEKTKAITLLYQSGMSALEIALALSVSEETVEEIGRAKQTEN